MAHKWGIRAVTAVPEDGSAPGMRPAPDGQKSGPRTLGCLQTLDRGYSPSVSAIIDELEAQALALTDGQRAELAERLVESLASPRTGAAQQAWLALAKRRRDELRSGQVAGIPGEEGSALVRRLVGR